MSDPVNERGKLMESLFFKRQDEELLEQLREKRKDQELREQLNGRERHGRLRCVGRVDSGWV